MTPENVGAVRQSCARKHATALGLSASTFKRILHLESKFSPYMMEVQKLSPRDTQNRMLRLFIEPK